MQLRTLWYLFFFNDTATTEIYTLSLHDAPSDLAGPAARSRWTSRRARRLRPRAEAAARAAAGSGRRARDRKSTRLNSSHANISYAVFCLKKKKLIYYSIFS